MPIERVICVCKLTLYDWTYGILKLAFVVAMVTLPPASGARVLKLVKGLAVVGVNDIGLPNGKLPEPMNGPGMSWTYIRPYRLRSTTSPSWKISQAKPTR